MKKFWKVVFAILAILAGVAGGLFLYMKLRDKKDELEDDFDDDYDDDFSDDDDSTYIKVEPTEAVADDDAETVEA